MGGRLQSLLSRCRLLLLLLSLPQPGRSPHAVKNSSCSQRPRKLPPHPLVCSSTSSRRGGGAPTMHPPSGSILCVVCCQRPVPHAGTTRPCKPSSAAASSAPAALPRSQQLLLPPLPPPPQAERRGRQVAATTAAWLMMARSTAAAHRFQWAVPGYAWPRFPGAPLDQSFNLYSSPVKVSDRRGEEAAAYLSEDWATCASQQPVFLALRHGRRK